MTELELFLKQHWRLALWVARRRVRHARGGLDPDDAESDALLGLWNAARTYDPARGGAPTWVRWTVERAITDGVRTRLHRRPAPRTIDIDDVPETFLPATPSPASAVAVRVDLRRAARCLKDRERRVLGRWLDGEHLATIGADLHVTESRASQINTTSRRKLQRALAVNDHGPHPRLVRGWGPSGMSRRAEVLESVVGNARPVQGRGDKPCRLFAHDDCPVGSRDRLPDPVHELLLSVPDARSRCASVLSMRLAWGSTWDPAAVLTESIGSDLRRWATLPAAGRR